MPANPLRAKYIHQLIGQLRGVEVVEGQRLIAKWLAEEKLTKAELVARLTHDQRAALLGAPAPPFQNWISGLALVNRPEGKARLAEWEQAAAAWRRSYLGLTESE